MIGVDNHVNDAVFGTCHFMVVEGPIERSCLAYFGRKRPFVTLPIIDDKLKKSKNNVQDKMESGREYSHFIIFVNTAILPPVSSALLVTSRLSAEIINTPLYNAIHNCITQSIIQILFLPQLARRKHCEWDKFPASRRNIPSRRPLTPKKRDFYKYCVRLLTVCEVCLSTTQKPLKSLKVPI